MPRPNASRDLEIANLEAFLATSDSFYTSGSSNGASASRVSRVDVERRLEQLYRQKDIAEGRFQRFARNRHRGGLNL
jgi:hypothetical protein